MVDHDGSKLLLGSDAETKNIHTIIQPPNCPRVSFDVVLNRSDNKQQVHIMRPVKANNVLMIGITYHPLRIY